MALLIADHGRAHDLWIEPSSFHPPAGSTVAVGLRVGQNFVGDAVPHISSSIEQFVVRQGGNDETIKGVEGADPAGWLRADGRSTAVIAYRSSGSFIELPADKFEDYLWQEGLDGIVEARTQRGERARPGRERFYRYAKALLRGEQPSDAALQPLGFAFEIVPDADPTLRFAPLRGHVLHDGRPLAGALVMALWHSDPSVRLAVRSDAHGAFAFDLPRGGVWLIKSVHMVRASFFSGADWNSLWASLTFEMPGPPP